ncbi:hypothetical protein ACFS3C_17145 [Azotobacter vinelandii]
MLEIVSQLLWISCHPWCCAGASFVQMSTRECLRLSYAATRPSIERVIDFLKLGDSDIGVAIQVERHHTQLARPCAACPASAQPASRCCWPSGPNGTGPTAGVSLSWSALPAEPRPWPDARPTNHLGRTGRGAPYPVYGNALCRATQPGAAR